MSAQPLYVPIYAKDWLADLNVIAMTTEEEGAYFRLILFCWTEGSISKDVRELAAATKLSPERMVEVWKVLAPRFKERGGRFIHERVEQERKLSVERINARTESARKASAARWTTPERKAPGKRKPSERELAAYAILDAAFDRIQQHVELALTAEAWKRRNKQGALDLVDAGLTPPAVLVALKIAHTHPEAKKFYGSLSRLDKLAEALPRLRQYTSRGADPDTKLRVVA